MQIKIVCRMNSKGMSLKEIADLTGLDTQTVQHVFDEHCP